MLRDVVADWASLALPTHLTLSSSSYPWYDVHIGTSTTSKMTGRLQPRRTHSNKQLATLQPRILQRVSFATLFMRLSDLQ